MTRISILVCTVFILSTSALRADYESLEPVDFSLQQLHGDAVSLVEFRPKWVVLNYWATWCAPCRKEIPDLSALNVARDDVVVLGLAYEDTDMENFDEFLEEYQPSYPILLVDVYAPPEPFGAPKALPTTIILNPEGYPVKTFFGPVTREDIESFIDSK
ncbi:MAG TPA: TlpA disulfide reductase family protein [Xanthomonadales bacterium]